MLANIPMMPLWLDGRLRGGLVALPVNVSGFVLVRLRWWKLQCVADRPRLPRGKGDGVGTLDGTVSAERNRPGPLGLTKHMASALKDNEWLC